jgi:hypothetical protein
VSCARLLSMRADLAGELISTTFGLSRYTFGVMPNTDLRRVATAIRLPEVLHSRLQEQAEMRDVSVNWLVTRAVERFLDTLPSREQVEATLVRKVAPS